MTCINQLLITQRGVWLTSYNESVWSSGVLCFSLSKLIMHHHDPTPTAGLRVYSFQVLLLVVQTLRDRCTYTVCTHAFLWKLSQVHTHAHTRHTYWHTDEKCLINPHFFSLHLFPMTAPQWTISYLGKWWTAWEEWVVEQTFKAWYTLSVICIVVKRAAMSL